MKTNSKENRANCVYMASGATIVHPRSSSVTGDGNNISKNKPFIESSYPQWDPSSRPKPLLNPDLIVEVKNLQLYTKHPVPWRRWDDIEWNICKKEVTELFIVTRHWLAQRYHPAPGTTTGRAGSDPSWSPAISRHTRVHYFRDS